MQAVAVRAGVSTMTVSNVINGRKKVLDSTREAVLLAIEDLGYRPNAAAQALASAAPTRVGLLYHNIENAFLSALLVGALSAATRLGAQLLIRPFEAFDLATVRGALDKLIGSGANGVLLVPPICELLNDSDVVEHCGVPLIATAPGAELSRMPSVLIDNVAAAREMTAHLVAMGHRRIGFIRAPGGHMVRQTRLEGYRLALAEAALPYDPVLVVDGTMRFESGLAAAAALLALPDRPTAIFSSNDDMAAAVVSVAHRAGLHVPDDLSVVGFDDGPIAVKIWPALTTVRQPVSAIADRATTALIEILRCGQPAPVPSGSIQMPYGIVHRESVARIGPPPPRRPAAPNDELVAEGVTA